MLAAFNGTWDWTAVGTLALALVTAIGLLIGRSSLRQGQRQVEQAHRPVVVPVAALRFQETIGGYDARPKLATETLKVPIENAGTGPALEIEASVEILNPGGEWSQMAGHPRLGVSAALGASSNSTLEVPLAGYQDTPGFRLSLTYRDVADKSWTTTARWVPDHNRYEDVKVKAGRSAP